MAQLHYTAEVRAGLLLELPEEAKELRLKPGDRVDIQLDLPEGSTAESDSDPTIALLESWMANAPADSDSIREAEEDLGELKRNLNSHRKETGARLLFPEVE